LVSEFRRILAVDGRLASYTVTLSELDKNQVVYLDCRNSDKPLGFTFQVGMRLPAVYSATGKAMLAYISDEERDEILSAPWGEPFTGKSVANREKFDADMEVWRAQGYAIDNGEIREGMVCLGAPILNPQGQPVAGIAISMTGAEARLEVQKKLGTIVRDIANVLAQHYTS
jgi:DNA-binding IclR family transcriptional regulator